MTRKVSRNDQLDSPQAGGDETSRVDVVRLGHSTLQRLVESSPFGIYIVDSDFRVAYMNAGSQRGAFRNVRPVIGRDFGETMRILWPEPVAAEIVSHFRRTLDTGEPHSSGHFMQPRADVEGVQSYKWELHRILLPDGRFGLVCYFRDTNEAVQARELLRAAEETSRRRAEGLARLYALSERSVRPEVSLEECLRDVLDTALWIMGTEKGNIQLFDEANGVLKLVVHQGFPQRFR